MTATVRRRPIASHPVFAPVIASWLAALLGLTVAVLPSAVIENGLAAIGLGALAPLSLGGRIGTSAVAAAVGALVGYVLARRLAHRAGGNPHPLYAESAPEAEEAVVAAPLRRPLRVREELADGFGDESQVAPAHAPTARPTAGTPPVFAAQTQAQDGFMILTPQPIHPPRPAPDLEALLDQFDSAFAAFSADESAGRRADAADRFPRTDTVQAFVARQTGTAALAGASAERTSPIGGLVPDHQAELRAALDKLARSQRRD